MRHTRGLLSPEEGHALLNDTKLRAVDEQGRRTANRVAELFLAGQARTRALQEARATSLRGSGRWSNPGASSSSIPSYPRKRRKWYAVRKGRNIGIFDTWEECERQTKGVASEFRSFPTLDEAKAYLTGRRLNFMTFRRSSKPESSFIGDKALRAQLDVWQDGHTDCLRVECGLDTMSDVNLAVAELLHDVHDIVLDDVWSSSGKTSFAKEGTLKVLSEGDVLSLPALVATTSQLPRSCSVLLGVPGLNHLGVSIDRHREKQRQPLMCYVREKTLRKWWEANEGQAAPAVVHDITQKVDVCPDLPAKMQARVRELLRQYESVFEGRQVTMPKPFQAEPVELKFIENPVPQSVPEPRWTHAQRLVLSQWAEAGLKDGSLELSTSRWASRPHIVMKTPANQHKDLVEISKCKIRVCGDYRAVNSQIVKIVPNLPTGLVEVEKAAGHDYYWESDSVACYSQFTLAKGKSREALAVWTPPQVSPANDPSLWTEEQWHRGAGALSCGRRGNASQAAWQLCG